MSPVVVKTQFSAYQGGFLAVRENKTGQSIPYDAGEEVKSQFGTGVVLKDY